MNIDTTEANQKALARIESLNQSKLGKGGKHIPWRKTVVTINRDGTKTFLRAPGNVLFTQMRRWSNPKDQVSCEIVLRRNQPLSLLRLKLRLGLVIEKEIPKSTKATFTIDKDQRAFIQYQNGLQVLTLGPSKLSHEQMMGILKKGRLTHFVGLKTGSLVDFRVGATLLGQTVQYAKVGHTTEKAAIHV